MRKQEDVKWWGAKKGWKSLYEQNVLDLKIKQLELEILPSKPIIYDFHEFPFYLLLIPWKKWWKVSTYYVPCVLFYISRVKWAENSVNCVPHFQFPKSQNVAQFSKRIMMPVASSHIDLPLKRSKLFMLNSTWPEISMRSIPSKPAFLDIYFNLWGTLWH